MYIRRIKMICIGILLGLGTFMSLISAFSIAWPWPDLYKGGIYKGMVMTWNRLAEVLGNTDGLVIKKLAGGGDYNGLFLCLVLILLIAISFMIVKSENKWLLLLYFVPIIFPSIFFNIEPSILSICIWLAGMGLALIFMDNEGLLSFWNTAFVLGSILIILFVFQLPIIASFLEKPPVLVSLDKNIEAVGENLYYGSNPLKEGDLSIEKRTGGEETALEVKMSDPDSLYLRGFVGEVYLGNKWQALDYSAYYENRDMAYWLNRKDFNGLGQIGKVENTMLGSEKKAEEKVNKIEINVKKADKKYAYIPYEIAENSLEDSVNWGNSYITSGKWGRMKSYSYNAYENAVNHWTDIAGRLFTLDRGDDYYDYMVKESHYNSFVYKNYTFIDDRHKGLLKEYLGSPGDPIKGHLEYKEAIEKVKNYLGDNFIYTENSVGVEDMESFLESKKGYDVHFASAATLIFRYYGIPARYVEGYLLTPQDIEGKTSEELIEIPRDNNHAWAEIYVDGLGFVPIETSPAYEGVMEEADLSIGLSNKSLDETFEEKAREIKDKSEEKKVKEGKGKRYLIWIFTIIFLILLALFLLYLLFLLVRKAIRLLVEKRYFYNKDYKLAVSAIYGYMTKKGLSISDEVRDMGNKAAYSKNEISKGERKLMLQKLREMKREAKDVRKRKS